MWSYSYTEIFNHPPNVYNELFYKIPTNSFVEKDGIIQKIFPPTHLYIPNKSNFIGQLNYNRNRLRNFD